MAMLTGIILAVLGVLIVVAYLKREQPWAKPVLVLCVVAICGVVLWRVVERPRARWGGAPYGATTMNAARLLGESLRGRVDSGARVLVLTENPAGVGPGWPQIRAACEAGFSEGLGDVEWELVGCVGPAPGTAETLSQAIEAAGVRFEVVLSFAGLPADLAQMSLYRLSPQPVVAAYFPRGADSELLRTWLHDGLIDAAVVAQNDRLEAYTPRNVP